ncbi:uncharacterized protein LOC119738606 [Patiria miniata]|uniref:Uncharacterized protein n=1 Tax=Patiria miniata TaxID=46514 RepID=A0A914AZ60_PATMI|nr:uncharacterized protein LOC119738606 [Patiria miniata]XP_038069441.1 uncharacterized protein LOC119738606 [Patiria miniata]
MIGKVLLACLLCGVLATCSGSSSSSSTSSSSSASRGPRSLERLLRRSVAIASSLHKLRSARVRRWESSSPIWKRLHRIQQRAMDFSGMPDLSLIPDAVQVARAFDETHKLVNKDLNDIKLGWQDKPFDLPGLPPQPAAAGWDEEPSDDWGPVVYPGLPDNHEDDWGEFLEPCSDDIVGNACTHNSDCPGCGAFHCSSSTNRCVAGAEPDPNFGGFF